MTIDREYIDKLVDKPLQPSPKTNANYPPRLDLADDCKVSRFGVDGTFDTHKKVVSNGWRGWVPFPWLHRK